MAPPVEVFPASSLKYHAQANLAGTKRKDFHGDLKRCELFDMLQYDCKVEEPRDRKAQVRCWPIERFFRKCRDRKGTFTVETTAWEGKEKGFKGS